MSSTKRKGTKKGGLKTDVVDKIWDEEIGDGPLVAIALHDGHSVRKEVASLLALNEEERLREEDPYTSKWTTIAPTRVVALRSRFEVDLNRPREKAVYLDPEDAWGLEVWKYDPSQGLVERSLAEYDAFYERMHHLLSDLEERFGRFVVFDLHSYNHLREGPGSPPADEEENPQVNLGTESMDRDFWSPLVERFMADLSQYDFPGGRLDVRENVKFKGGNFAHWVHETFPSSGCVLAIEIKKFFMDEWTGKLDKVFLQAVRDALGSTVHGVLEELKRL